MNLHMTANCFFVGIGHCADIAHELLFHVAPLEMPPKIKFLVELLEAKVASVREVGVELLIVLFNIIDSNSAHRALFLLEVPRLVSSDLKLLVEFFSTNIARELVLMFMHALHVLHYSDMSLTIISICLSADRTCFVLWDVCIFFRIAFPLKFVVKVIHSVIRNGVLC